MRLNGTDSSSYRNYIQVVFNTKWINPTKLKIYARTDTSSGYNNAILQASIDGTNWEEIARTGELIKSSTSFREETVNISTTKYYKYFKVTSAFDKDLAINKLNISGYITETLDLNRLDLNLGCEEYYDGMKLSIRTPDNLDERYTTKLQLDGLGYKDITAIAGQNMEYLYNGTKFALANKAILGSYTGENSGFQIGSKEIILGAKPIQVFVTGYGLTETANGTHLALTNNGFRVWDTRSGIGTDYTGLNRSGIKYVYVAIMEV